MRIADDGEILTRSAGVFQGYLNNPDATAEAVDADGWLHTGDVGELDADGFLRITDRKKDIIITAGGKNISPSEIENLLKVSPFVREAVVIGDRRKYLTALIGIELDTVGNWASRRGLAYTTYADLSAKPEVHALIDGVVREANEQLAQVEKIKRFTLIGKELDHEDGELTATQKVKRRAMADTASTPRSRRCTRERLLTNVFAGLALGSTYALGGAGFRRHLQVHRRHQLRAGRAARARRVPRLHVRQQPRARVRGRDPARLCGRRDRRARAWNGWCCGEWSASRRSRSS